MTGKRRGPAARTRRVKRETSAGGVVFRLDQGRPLYLLIRDAYGNWGFPKGHVEKGERPETAAVREVKEETGLPSLTVRDPLDVIEWLFTWRGALVKKRCHFYLMETAESATAPQSDEGITECQWTPADEALRLVRYDNARAVLRRADEIVASIGERTGRAAGGAR